MNDDLSGAGLLQFPYTGLRPFEPHEAALFFGRAEQIEGMLSQLETHRFLAVVGASGCGKSSLVRAGLLPALADGFLMGAGDDWHFVIARPGDAPFANLAHALANSVDGPGLLVPPTKQPVADSASPDKSFHLALVEKALRGSRGGLADALAQCEIPSTAAVLILVDQFEELFRFRDLVRRDKAVDTYESRNEAMAFVDLLLHSLKRMERRVYLVITMRSDFMGDCDAFPGLPEAISDSQFLAPRMTRSQLAEAIQEPLAVCGYSVEPGFVNRVLNDVGSEPDQLPLMQHALLRTWELTRTASGARDGASELRIANYEQVGAVHGALNQHAEQIFKSLGDEMSRGRLQRVAERLFCSLSDRRDGGPLTRRAIKVSRVALEAGATELDIEVVARAFQAANLLVFSPPGQPLGPQTRLDISHESLLRQWSRLGAWIDAEAKSALSYRRLMDAVQGGESHLGDTHLAQAQEWLTVAQPTVHWAMRYDRALQPEESLFKRACALIEFSHQARLDRLAKEQAAAEREQRLLREKAEVEIQRARDAEAAVGRELEQAQRFAESKSRMAAWMQRLSLSLAILMLLVGYFWFRSNQDKVAARTRELVGASKSTADVDPELSLLLAQRAYDYSRSHRFPGIQGALQFSRQNLLTALLASHVRAVLTNSDQTPFRMVAYSPNGAAIAAYDLAIPTTHSGRLWVWRPQESNKMYAAVGKYEQRSLKFAPDSQSVWISGYDKQARRWSFADSQLKELESIVHTDRLLDARFQPNGDGSMVITADTGKVWLRRAGELQQNSVLDLEPGLKTVDFSPDGKWAAAAAGTNELRLVEVATSRMWCTHVPASELIQLRFSPDSRRLIAVYGAGGAGIWEVSAPSTMEVPLRRGFTFELENVRDAVFSPDSQSVGFAMADGEVRIRSTRGGVAAVFKGHRGQVNSLAFAPNGKRLVSAGQSGSLREWDVEMAAGRLVQAPNDQETLETCSADGHRALLGIKSEIYLRDLTSSSDRTNMTLVPSLPKDFSPPVFRPDGLQFAVSASGQLSVRDAGSGQIIRLLGTNFAPQVKPLIAYSGDGRWLIGAYPNGQIHRWSATGLVESPFGKRDKSDAAKFISANWAGDVIAVARYDERSPIEFWSSGGKPPVELARPHPLLYSVAIDPSGTLVAAGGQNDLWLWRIGLVPQLPHHLPGHKTSVNGLAWSSDGRFLATGDAEGRILLWEVNPTRRSDDAPSAVCIGRRGEVPYGNDAGWDLKTVAFSNDGGSLLTAGADGGIRIFPLPELMNGVDLGKFANDRLTRKLTIDEEKDYGF